MNLKELLHNIDIDAKVYGKISPIEVRNLTKDSRNIGFGDIFIANKGKRCDGNDFASLAVENGAIAVVSSIYNPFLSVVQIISPNLSLLEAQLAAKYYNYPSRKLCVVGITGTNGKTTVSHLIKFLFDACDKPSGLIGTIEHILGNNRIQDGFTTPESCLLQKYLAEMVKSNLTAAVIETSSIGLVLDRLANVEFDVGVLTNVTLDHLDFHDSFEEYIKAKLQLFAQLSDSGLAVVNNDLPQAKQFLEATRAVPVTYGIEQLADYRASNLRFSPFGADFDLIHKGEIFPCHSPLIGQYNVYNVLAAIAVTHQRLNCDLQQLVSLVASVKSPRGRLEPIQSGPCPIYIDYAHTPDALDNVCQTLRTLLPSGGKLIVVFGCGGDRDRSKRKIMAQVVEKYGFAVVTSDNPRGEDPETIVNEICSGFVKRNFSIEIDRKQAITYALSIASDRDIVLVAGKGHETYQIFKHQTIAFDDREVVHEVLSSYV
ncbi:UDP-N-acetylmuramoylalanyl-D-glutamate--2, 6-diaminopimelate ligase [Chlamydia felis Fe/C-56]|uniref:UDP-N-acetylmuramoyl-L-alanyl-D-glutamate--2,6-diaminopimelate ligase n=1 Tax=Chlamydia felis (strain Fe/C-56) TaxID=264202 RepID=MURE_CHLFF|nr:UDP-N-acetylmuramoyl-L-alanyl-D-glutamate--2,6-diaminopimelate ligase [Chlamydia felis]Q253Y4.1 RecName: Full=UDP-N-acetylmuramoyl-L-alanyl-D-glutamate--2,6-diaminopimelate ligase; AltName: Full=Meso-A2pm-adding enzyme; AltName: Full=Meso-diaminopimelate-adding enzyme; AltName: Full=UDP-MurNAc-L-Ala-D-Glu:meso-diaminopimelate ligase; AltName: Full=UDP-MurNAc-tripeptide synthetase; AltName: Full=UDP-N-acetylmuramyl-tripeptide synthetase [Chlamydia felis Fe/C-56]BAE81404.1 UDP-N-acetylmuramoylal